MKKTTPKGIDSPSVYADRCPLLCALDIIGGKWKLPIIWFLSQEEHVRFNELRRRVSGVTNMMLAKCLRELETDGLVRRTQYEVIPPHVEYSLTASARELVPILRKLYAWGAAHASRDVPVAAS
ncbi:MAG: helix-turn-helix transcriptional regulator [Desulfovibrio sp.]|nr:helix-turn-helix transcriptional regulator [Desulfovibrio sp.]